MRSIQFRNHSIPQPHGDQDLRVARSSAVLLLLIVALLSFTGCLRYTPSRSELYEAKASSPKRASEKDFRFYEEQQEKQLKSLIARRTADAKEKDEWYRIGPGDAIKVFVFDVPELNVTVRVSQNGQITLPLLGSVGVVGKNESELQEEVRSKLDNFVHDPQVIVSIANYAANKASVLGEVARPGTIPLKRGDITLIDIISEAGGRTEKAGSAVILIPADESAKSARSALASNSTTGDATKASAGARALSPNPILQRGVEIPFDRLVGNTYAAPVAIPVLPGDTIIIPAAGVVQLDGEVTNPGSVQLASRMTLLGAIAAAGGVTYSADVKDVELIREVEPGKKSILSVNLEKLVGDLEQDIRLRDGDIVRVPSHGGRFVTRQIMDAVNSVLSFGVGGTVNVAK